MGKSDKRGNKELRGKARRAKEKKAKLSSEKSGKNQKLKEIHTKEHSVKNKSKEKMAKERDIGRRLSVCEAKENKLKRIHGERCEKRGKLATSKTASKEKKRKADERQTEARAAVQEKEMQCTLLKERVRRRDGNERKLK